MGEELISLALDIIGAVSAETSCNMGKHETQKKNKLEKLAPALLKNILF